jgi:hypothetical protein
MKLACVKYVSRGKSYLDMLRSFLRLRIKVEGRGEPSLSVREKDENEGLVS